MTRCLLLLLLSPALTAAPPTLGPLFPAGAGRGQSLELNLPGPFSRWPVQAWCSDTGVSLKPLAQRGKFAVAVGKDVRPGVSWIRLHDEEGASVARPFVLGSLPEGLEQEPNDDPKRAMKVDAVGVVVNGKLGQPGDVDCFALELRKGQTLVAELLANEVLGSPMDAVLQVVSSDGFVLAENHDEFGLDPRVVFTATTDGLHVVRLFAFPSQPDSTIRFAGAETYLYRLTLTAGPYADHAFPLAVARKNPGTVDAIGWNLPASARGLKPLPSDTDEAVLLDPLFVRPLTVRVEDHACVVEPAPGPHAVPVTISGRIGARGEVDVHRLTARKGQPLVVQVESHALGFPLDAALRLTDGAGKLLVEQDDVGPNHDPTLTYTPSADGELRVEVRDLHGHGSPRHVYRLRVTPPEPSFTLTVAADRFTAAVGKPLDIPVSVAVQNGFREEIELRAEGVDAPPVRWSPGKGPAILKLTAKGPLSAGFRIVGRAAGKVRDARAGSLPHLWLTVPR